MWSGGDARGLPRGVQSFVEEEASVLVAWRAPRGVVTDTRNVVDGVRHPGNVMFAWGTRSPFGAASGPEEKEERGPAGPFREGAEAEGCVRKAGNAHTHSHTATRTRPHTQRREEREHSSARPPASQPPPSSRLRGYTTTNVPRQPAKPCRRRHNLLPSTLPPPPRLHRTTTTPAPHDGNRDPLR
ncbi:hypothetical protein E2C01_089585 [Portunus trituberculatus]|uniref:Uncharacterized protein n=1 Tax=Portunus trituberculatus TaxID=210409 RepID=A0A5B7JJF3_PORTR|nr:hypothetical protein [Portunus trituberculatus]